MAVGAVIGAAAFAWVASALRPFTIAMELAVAAPVIVALALALRPSSRAPTRSPGSARSGAAVWIVLGAAAVAWQLAAYWSSPRSAHPTLSVIADEIMSVRPGRALVFLCWLALGGVLVASSRRRG
jgi:hypothetical protein